MNVLKKFTSQAKKIGTWLPNGDECKKCEYLIELYNSTEKSNQDYWLMTELFVMLHGTDECRTK